MLKDREELYINLIKESDSLIDVCRKANIVPTTGNYNTLKKIIKEKEIDISHFKRNNCNSTTKRDIEKYLNNEYPISSYKLKYKLLNAGLKEYKCEKCGNTEWYGKPIPLELHHVNGNNQDNSLNNLQILCPNCHTFTDTYGGKNQKINTIKRYCKTCGKELHNGQKVYCSINCMHYKKNTVKKGKNNKTVKESNDQKIPLILDSLKRTKTFTGTAKEFNVSDNAIRKLLVKRGYPRHIKELLKLIE